MTKCRKFAIVLFIFFQFNSGLSIRLIDIQLPSISVFGKSAQLNCTYDLENDQLYSIKWFHNNAEFYRYLPNDNPPEQFYSTKGLYVDLNKSSKSLVFLKKVDLRTNGLFRVEVSAEAPSFQTVRKEKHLNVYYFPRNPPVVKLLKNTTTDLRLNDVLDVSCQSGAARPATKLQFFINDLPIRPEFANLTEIINPIVLEDEFDESEIPPKSSVFDSSTDQESNDYQLNSINNDQNNLVLFNTTLRLQIRIRQSLLKSRKTINLRCASYVTHLFIKTSEHVFTILNDDQQNLIADMSRTFNRKKNANANKLNFNKKTFGPFLEGARNNYAVGDLINVTCFTGNSYPPAYLQWFINDHEAPNEFLKYYKPIETKDGLKSLLGLNFRLTEEFLNYQQELNMQKSTQSPDDESGNYQELSVNHANQTVLNVSNDRNREIKLKCTGQLNRIIHVRNARIKQFQLDDQTRLGDTANRSTIDTCSYVMQFVLFLFILIYN